MAALPCFFEDTLLADGATLALSEETARHVVQVLRKKEGDRILISNGRGQSAEATIVAAGKKTCTAVLSEIRAHMPPAYGLHLAVAFTKSASRNEWLLEKATEMGVLSITPLLTERTEREKFRDDRARNIAVSAMLQSQQYFLPAIRSPQTLAQLLDAHRDTTTKLIAHCEGEFARKNLHKAAIPRQHALVLIGPEGDFTPAEINFAHEQGCTGISLCSQRLRTETAAMAVCAYFNLLNHD